MPTATTSTDRLVRRVDTARGHHYVDARGYRVPGVTTIIGNGLPKPALITWAATATADYAVNHWDELADMAPAARLKVLNGARYAERDAASNRGTAVHRHAEALITGAEIEVPEALAGYVEAYAAFLDDYDVTPVLTEFGVYHPTYNYAGTADLLADLTLDGERVRALLDIKTSRSGIFGETALQLAAYGHAAYWLGASPEVFSQPIAWTGAVHVRADGYALVPVVAGEEQFEAFLDVQKVAGWMDGSRDLIGEGMVGRDVPRYRLTLADQAAS